MIDRQNLHALREASDTLGCGRFELRNASNRNQHREHIGAFVVIVIIVAAGLEIRRTNRTVVGTMMCMTGTSDEHNKSQTRRTIAINSKAVPKFCA